MLPTLRELPKKEGYDIGASACHDVGSCRTHAQCHNLLDELMPQPLTQDAMGRPSICLRHDQGGVLVCDVLTFGENCANR